MNSKTANEESPRARFTRRAFLMGGAVGAGVLTLGAIAYRITVLPKGAPAVAGGVLTAQEMLTVEALALGYFPPGNPMGIDARDAGVAGYVDRYIAQMSPIDQKIVRALIWAYDQGTVMAGRWKPARLMTPEEAGTYLRSWETSRFGWRRDLGMSLRTVLGMAYFAHPVPKEALGIVEPCHSPGPRLVRIGNKV